MPFLRRRFRRQRVEWTGNTSNTPTVIGASALSTQTLLSQAVLEEWPRGTLVRLIGSLFVSPATAPAAATGYAVYLGLYWQQQTVGTFDPEVNQDANVWKWWHVIFPQIGGTGASDQNAARWAGYFPFTFDLKMRHKFTDYEQFLLAVKNSAASGASIQFSYAFRYLIKAGV